MQFFSTNNKSLKASFKEATIRGLAPDRGLYFPETIPRFEKEFIDNIEQFSDEEIAYQVITPYAGEDIPAGELKRIVSETVNFPIPLVPLTNEISTLELFHGPTLAFKDIGARFMSRCLGFFSKETNKNVIVLVATSGDTGGAVADGFYNVPGVDVVILYPSGKVSNVQEKQLTTLGKNIHALEVDGVFDDCQTMVKETFLDKEINRHLFLTSANSINVARWLPQQFYYLFAYKQWLNKNEPPVISVPSGNFGNICAAMLAEKSGMPVKHFIAACNANDVVPRFFKNGKYDPQKAISTISNAMDVGDPSNFVRILELFGQDALALSGKMTSLSFSDEETRKAIRELKAATGYLADPHGAVGYLALRQYLNENGGKGYFVETAHPVKFHDVMEPIINDKVPVPAAVLEQLKKEKKATKISASSTELQQFLMRTFK